MGNSSSSSIKCHNHHNEIGTTISHKVPKHLQPTKRKQTKKRSNTITAVAAAKETNTTATIANNNNDKKHDTGIIINNNNDETQPNSHIKTLQPNPNNEINEIFMMDHSSSSPQLFRWTKGRRFQNTEVSTTGVHVKLSEKKLSCNSYYIQGAN
jgi:hypothetical protein